jgi:hypothetical protein
MMQGHRRLVIVAPSSVAVADRKGVLPAEGRPSSAVNFDRCAEVALSSAELNCPADEDMDACMLFVPIPAVAALAGVATWGVGRCSVLVGMFSPPEAMEVVGAGAALSSMATVRDTGT